MFKADPDDTRANTTSDLARFTNGRSQLTYEREATDACTIKAH